MSKKKLIAALFSALIVSVFMAGYTISAASDRTGAQDYDGYTVSATLIGTDLLLDTEHSTTNENLQYQYWAKQSVNPHIVSYNQGEELKTITDNQTVWTRLLDWGTAQRTTEGIDINASYFNNGVISLLVRIKDTDSEVVTANVYVTLTKAEINSPEIASISINGYTSADNSFVLDKSVKADIEVSANIELDYWELYYGDIKIESDFDFKDYSIGKHNFTIIGFFGEQQCTFNFELCLYDNYAFNKTLYFSSKDIVTITDTAAQNQGYTTFTLGVGLAEGIALSAEEYKLYKFELKSGTHKGTIKETIKNSDGDIESIVFELNYGAGKYGIYPTSATAKRIGNTAADDIFSMEYAGYNIRQASVGLSAFALDDNEEYIQLTADANAFNVMVNKQLKLSAYGEIGGEELLYAFYREDYTGWTQMRGYLADSNLFWTPTYAGSFAIQVRIMDKNSGSYEAVKSYRFNAGSVEPSLEGTIKIIDLVSGGVVYDLSQGLTDVSFIVNRPYNILVETDGEFTYRYIVQSSMRQGIYLNKYSPDSNLLFTHQRPDFVDIIIRFNTKDRFGKSDFEFVIRNIEVEVLRPIVTLQTTFEFDQSQGKFSESELNEMFGQDAEIISAVEVSGRLSLSVESGNITINDSNGEYLATGETFDIIFYTHTKAVKVKVTPITKIINTASDLTYFYTNLQYIDSKPNIDNAQTFGGYYVLGGNIDASTFTAQKTGVGSLSVGEYVEVYKTVGGSQVIQSGVYVKDFGLTGIFDGRGYTIYNYKSHGYGLFGVAAGTIKNLKIEVVMQNDRWDDSVLAVILYKEAVVENVNIVLTNPNNLQTWTNGKYVFVSAMQTETTLRNVIIDASVITTDMIKGHNYAALVRDLRDGATKVSTGLTNTENVYVISGVEVARTSGNVVSYDAENCLPESANNILNGVKRYTSVEEMIESENLISNTNHPIFASGYYSLNANNTQILFGEERKFSIDKAEVSIILNGEETLSALYDGNVVAGVTWSSSDQSVCTVDSSGKVQALKIGTATITATYNNYSSTSIVTVGLEGQVPTLSFEGVENSQTQLEITVNKSIVFEHKVSFNGNEFTDGDIVYTFTDSTIAEIISGELRGLKIGSTTLTAKVTWRGVTLEKNFTVTIVKDDVTVTVDNDQIELYTISSHGGVSYDTSKQITVQINGGEIPITEYNVTIANDEIVSYTKQGDKVTITALSYGITSIKISCIENDIEYYTTVEVEVLRPIATHQATFDFDQSQGRFIESQLIEMFGEGAEIISATEVSGRLSLSVESGNITINDSNGEYLATGETFDIIFYTQTKAVKVKVTPITKIINTASDLTYFYTNLQYIDSKPNIDNAQTFGGYYVLGGNIDASTFTAQKTGVGSLSVGEYVEVYKTVGGSQVIQSGVYVKDFGLTGIFDGRGYTIYNYKSHGYGLFGVVAGTIKNLKIEVVIQNDRWDDSILAWTLYKEAVVENVNIVLTNPNNLQTWERGKYVFVNAMQTETTLRNVIIDASVITADMIKGYDYAAIVRDLRDGATKVSTGLTNTENVYVISGVEAGRTSGNVVSYDAENCLPSGAPNVLNGIKRYTSEEDIIVSENLIINTNHPIFASGYYSLNDDNTKLVFRKT